MKITPTVSYLRDNCLIVVIIVSVYHLLEYICPHDLYLLLFLLSSINPTKKCDYRTSKAHSGQCCLIFMCLLSQCHHSLRPLVPCLLLIVRWSSVCQFNSLLMIYFHGVALIPPKSISLAPPCCWADIIFY